MGLAIGDRFGRGSLTTWASRLGLVVLVLAVALLAGLQFAQPDKRVMQVVAAGMVVFLAFRTKSISALMLAVLFIPFPKPTSYGNTNVAFVLLIFLVWIFRVTSRRATFQGRTTVDLPILCLIMAYCVSFYNVDMAHHFGVAWAKFLAFLSYLFLLYLVANVVRTKEDVQKILLAQALSCTLVCLFALYEQRHPGSAPVPGWLDFSATGSTKIEGVRVGSTFLDYELFGEYCALNFFLGMFLFTRARTRTRRLAVVGLMGLTLFCLFSTVTRGAVISLMAGFVYLGWLSRRRLNLPRTLAAVSGALVVLFGGDFLVSTFSKSGSVLARLMGSHLVGGVPDTRVGAWRDAVKYISEHPIIGHGPYYSIGEGLDFRYWPHNVYLYYASIVGLVGLTFYLWFLWKLWRASRPLAPSLGSGTYLEGATLLARVMLFTFMVDQVKIDYLRNERYSFWVWFFFGTILAISLVARREARAAATSRDEAGPPVPETRTRNGRAALRPVSLEPAVPARIAP